MRVCLVYKTVRIMEEPSIRTHPVSDLPLPPSPSDLLTTMGLLRVAFCMAFCLTSCLATYGSDSHYRKAKGGSEKIILDSPKIHLDSARIHLDSPKILVNRPKVYEEGHLIEEEPAYQDKSHHSGYSSHASAHSSHAAAPIFINGGYGGYGGYGGAKILNVGGPYFVASSPIAHHDGPILVRRPVVVAKELAPTQDHLEKVHYDRITLGKGGYISGGHGIGYGHGEKAIIYQKGAPLHGLGSGLISFQAYHTPYLIGQPKAILTAGPAHISAGHGHIDAGHGYISGGHGLIGGGHGYISGGHGLSGHGHSIAGHGHSLSGHGHSLSGHGHSLSGHGHSLSGHGHLGEIHGSGGHKKY